MTRPEQPQPYPGDLISALSGAVPYRREYRDPLGRPMRGTVTLTGQTATRNGDVVVLPAPVTVDLVNGVLEVHLPADTYSLTAALRSPDGFRISDSDTVTLA